MNRVIVCCVLLILSGCLYAAEIRVAVASNFKYTLQKLASDFGDKTGHELIISSASSGKLYAQIKHGAPYDVFLSADERRVDLLVAEGVAEAENAYVYALGKLVFVSNIESSNLESGDDCNNLLHSPGIQRLAIANPKIAPYGLAAKQILVNLELWPRLQAHIVRGENVSQAYQFVATKNADAGFVAESMLLMDAQHAYSCIWHVPADLHSPIKQKMVLLKQVKAKPAVQLFMQYLKSADAKAIISLAGYDAP